jgi:hypothetical protein
MLEQTLYGLALALIVVLDFAYGDDIPAVPEKPRHGRNKKPAFNDSPLARTRNSGLRRRSTERDDPKAPLLQTASLAQTCAVSIANDDSSTDRIDAEARDV